MGDRRWWRSQDRRPLRPGHRRRRRPDLIAGAGRGSDGQAAVELALLLPLVVVLLLGMLQVALVGRDQLAIELAAREAARAAAVSAQPVSAARRAADRVTTLRPVGVEVRVSASTVTVTIRHRTVTDVALVGPLVADVDLRAIATMALEPP